MFRKRFFRCCWCLWCCNDEDMYTKKYEGKEDEKESLIPVMKDNNDMKSNKRLSVKKDHKYKPVIIEMGNVNTGINRIKVKYHYWKIKYWQLVDELGNINGDLYEMVHSLLTTMPHNVIVNVYEMVLQDRNKNVVKLWFDMYFDSPYNPRIGIDMFEKPLGNELGLILERKKILEIYKERMKSVSYNEYYENHSFWIDIGIYSINCDHKVTLIVKNNSKKEIYIKWINYKGIEKQNGLVYSKQSTTIGTYVSQCFVIRILSSYCNIENETSKDKRILKKNNLCILGVYRIQNTYPTHIMNIDEEFNININCGTPIYQNISSHNSNPKKYIKTIIHGFKIYYDTLVFKEDPEIKNELSNDLFKITEMINPSILAVFQKYSIYVNKSITYGHYDNPINGEGIAFHADIKYMKQNNMDTSKFYNIEIYNINDYLEWKKVQIYILFHEFTHAFHHYIGKSRQDIIETYQNAMNNNLYDKVKHEYSLGKFNTQRAYAALNEFEYFAQLSEAYFGRCNYFPFNKNELKGHDIDGYNLCQKIWNFDINQISQEHSKYYN